MNINPVVNTSNEEGGLAQYRAQVRAWLAANLERRPVAKADQERKPLHKPEPLDHDIDDYPPEVMTANRALQKRLYDAGFAGIACPRRYGGQGLTLDHERVFLQEASSYVLPDFGSLTAMTHTVGLQTLLAHASEELLESLVPKILSGEVLICQFFSEPSSGSDLAGARTHAVRDGEDWLINGQKLWSTFAQRADWGLCLTRTDWDKPKHRGLTWFLVPTDSPGLSIRPIKQINGRSSFCEDFFDDVRVPDAYRVGELDAGWAVAQTMLVFERGAGRIAQGGPPLEAGPLAPDLADLARRTGRTGDPIVRQKLARAHTLDFVGAALRARIDQGLALTGSMDHGQAAYVKLFHGTYTPIRARLALEIGSEAAMGWQPEDACGSRPALEYLDARIPAIAGGSNEMQRNAISERILGLPREPSFDSGKPYRNALQDARRWGPDTNNANRAASSGTSRQNTDGST